MLSLIAFAVKLGVPTRFAKGAVIATLVVLAVVALGLTKCAYDKRVIDTHEAKQEAATAKADREADTTAAVQRRADDSRLTQEKQQLKEAQNGANSDLDRRLAFQRCLRLQQAARSERKQPPTCH